MLAVMGLMQQMHDALRVGHFFTTERLCCCQAYSPQAPPDATVRPGPERPATCCVMNHPALPV